VEEATARLADARLLLASDGPYRDKVREAYLVARQMRVHAELATVRVEELELRRKKLRVAVLRKKGFRDIPAPPMFAVVYSAGAVGPAVLDPEVGINFAMMVHGGQEFVWGEPVCAGDTITTEASVKDIYERGGMGFYVFESVSRNQDGQEVVRGTWTNIVRGS
jgi:hypothetical protein